MVETPPYSQDVPLAAATGSLLLGGSSTFLLNLAKALGRRGQRLPIVALSEELEHRDDFAATPAVLRSVSTQRMIYEDRIGWAYEQLAEFQPRAVLASLSSPSFEVLRLVPPGVARLGMIHSDDPSPFELVRAYGPWLDAMVGVSVEICSKIRTLPEAASLRVDHIPYGIDFPPAEPRPAPDRCRPLRVVYVGRLIEIQKRISRVVELIRKLEKQGANVRFTLVGGGPDEGKVREALAGSRITTLLGTISNNRVAQVLREQDVFVLLSDFEGLPLSLLEAMAEGVVPVISDLPSGLNDVVTPQTGCRVPIGDIEAAAQAILALERERSRLADLSRKAAAVARLGYSADRMADGFQELIRTLNRRNPEPWPRRAEVPEPILVAPRWLFRPWLRPIRRRLKPLQRILFRAKGGTAILD